MVPAHGLAGTPGRHQRIDGGLIHLDLMNKDVEIPQQRRFTLSGKIENHVGVERTEPAMGKQEALPVLIAAVVRVIAAHVPEQTIVKGLYTYRQAVDSSGFQYRQDVLAQVIGVGLYRNLPDREQ